MLQQVAVHYWTTSVACSSTCCGMASPSVWALPRLMRYAGSTEAAVTCQLTTRDRFGDTVSLDHSNWQKHQPRHPEVVPYHHALPLVLADPDLVLEFAATASQERTRHFYRRGVFQGPYAQCYMRVVVGYIVHGAKIKTVQAINYPRPMGRILWLRIPTTP